MRLLGAVCVLQVKNWNSNGVKEATALLHKFPPRAAASINFRHSDLPAAHGLSDLTRDLERNRTCLALAFMDDGHLFDDNMVRVHAYMRLLKLHANISLHALGRWSSTSSTGCSLRAASS